MRALALLLVVCVAHYGYEFLPRVADQRWLFYVARGPEVIALAALVLWPRPWPHPLARLIATFAAGLALVEELQVTVCGVAEWGVNTDSNLCMAWMGGHAYAALAAFIAALLIVLWRERHG